MTYTLNIDEETARRIENRAAQEGTAPEKVAEQVLVAAFTETRAERLRRLSGELFDERASAYEALAEGAK